MRNWCGLPWLTNIRVWLSFSGPKSFLQKSSRSLVLAFSSNYLSKSLRPVKPKVGGGGIGSSLVGQPCFLEFLASVISSCLSSAASNRCVTINSPTFFFLLPFSLVLLLAWKSDYTKTLGFAVFLARPFPRTKLLSITHKDHILQPCGYCQTSVDLF